MDWKAVASLAAPFAPTVGKILGGLIPVPGGALLGEWAGNALAKALGVPATPEAVGRAIQGTPPAELEAKLAKVEEEASARWDALARMEEARASDRTAQSQAINETIRNEVGSVSWWHWRNLIGYLVLIYGLQQVALLTFSAFFPKILPPGDAVALFNSTAIFTGGLFALLGYIASDTTDRYKTAITGDRGSGGIVENVIKAVKPQPKTVIIGKPVGSRD